MLADNSNKKDDRLLDHHLKQRRPVIDNRPGCPEASTEQTSMVKTANMTASTGPLAPSRMSNYAQTMARAILPRPGLLFRSLRYLITRSAIPASLVLTGVVLTVEGGWEGALLAILVLAGYLGWLVVTVERERAAVELLGWPPITTPHRDDSVSSAPSTWSQRIQEPATKREIVHAVFATAVAPIEIALITVFGLLPMLLAAPLLIEEGPVAVGPFSVSTTAGAWSVTGLTVILLLLSAHLLTAIAHGHASITAKLLGPRGDELRKRVIELTRSRSRLIDAFDIERRRIERDLHDGAQQQLVSLAMTLDLARIELETNPHPAVEPLVEQAHSQATTTLRELRQLIDGVHPVILTEQGLADAVQMLCDRSTIRTTCHAVLPGEIPSAVSSTAYFVVAEALTNAAKHSGAESVDVRLNVERGALVGSISDDGEGGADPEAGAGLLGLADRVSALDGTLTLSSPPGGPTVIQFRVPVRDPLEADL